MHPQPIAFPAIPAEISRAAKAVFGSSNFYIQVGEKFASICEPLGLENGGIGHLGEISQSLSTPPHLLPLATFFQFIEGLTDEQVADALRARMDWKFALHLPVRIPPFPAELFCEFRQRIITEPECQGELQTLVDRMIPLNPPIHAVKEAYEVLPLISSICSINCLENVRQILGAAIGALAIGFPQELRRIALPDWYGRYNPMASGSRPNAPAGLEEEWIHSLERDIPHLLDEVEKSSLPEIKGLPEIAALRQVWTQLCERYKQCGKQFPTGFKPCRCDFCATQRRGATGGNNNHEPIID